MYALSMDVEMLRAEVAALREEKQRLELALAELRQDEVWRAQDEHRLEHQLTRLARLCAASQRLHETWRREEVLETLREVLTHFIGSEELALFELDPTGVSLSLVAGRGIEPERFRRVPLGAGLIGRVALRGEPYFAPTPEPGTPSVERPGLSACIPLKLGPRVVGVIAIFRLLPRKEALDAGDHELLTLLSSLGARALFCARAVEGAV
jgi:GAF domain-containing protein